MKYELHEMEKVTVGKGWLYRVAVTGGWIYLDVDPNTGVSSAMCFVPDSRIEIEGDEE